MASEHVRADHRNSAVSEPCGCIHGMRGGVRAIQYCRVHREAPAMAELLDRLASINFNGSRDVDKACDFRDAARALLARIGATT